jgi:CubicO group peptidase (beta-lactamase class C family)
MIKVVVFPLVLHIRPYLPMIRMSTHTGVGETLYSKSLGSRTFDTAKDAPLQTDSVLWIASLTKLVTSIACMIAIEQGLLTLDENVREIVPELKDLDLLVGFEEGEHPRKPILKKTTAPISIR